MPLTQASCLPLRAFCGPMRNAQLQASLLVIGEPHGSRAHPRVSWPACPLKEAPPRSLPTPPQTPLHSLTGLAALKAAEVTRFPHFPLSFKTNQNADQHPLFVLGDQRKGKAVLWVRT